jgi:hypothetical protein
MMLLEGPNEMMYKAWHSIRIQGVVGVISVKFLSHTKQSVPQMSTCDQRSLASVKVMGWKKGSCVRC